MPYTTRCTCSESQLYLVGCDCDQTGPEKMVYTYEEEQAMQLEAEKQAAYDNFFGRQQAEADWYENELRKTFGDDYIDNPREDYHEYMAEAVKHQ